MLSHLRFHRRGNSNPTSPVPDLGSPLSAQTASFFPEPISSPDGRPPSSGSSALAPKLPPITRVTSAGAELLPDLRNLGLDSPYDADMTPPSDTRDFRDHRPQQTLRSPYNGDSGFIGGVALRNYRRDMEAQAASRSEAGDHIIGNNLDSQASHHRPRPAPSNAEALASRPPPQPSRHARPMTSFSTPTELHHPTTAAVGRRPAGARVLSEQPISRTPAASSDPPRGKKGLPFLKNPMSTLLLRRKNNHNVPDLLPLPLAAAAKEPVYDPRIRGTRVHDFSAPRRKPVASSNELAHVRPVAKTDADMSLDRVPSAPAESRDSTLRDDGGGSPRHMSNASDPGRSGSVGGTLRSMGPSSSVSSDQTKISMSEAFEPEEPAPPVPPKDDLPLSLRHSSSKASWRVGPEQVDVAKKTLSIRTTHSRNRSMSELSHKNSLSALPRHMKSTSSRFSFDMIGAAKQEKLLEERHRQRELEKQDTDPGPRDSRFDDFDDDAFDYDAMMDDDGLEERIPGVNADYDDDFMEEDIPMTEEYDFDDDLSDNFDLEEHVAPSSSVHVEEEVPLSGGHQNFSQFVFQSSDPTSTLTSPHSAGLAITPRDADGQVIGYAMTQETPKLQDFPSPPFNTGISHEPSPGLGIQGLDMEAMHSIQNSSVVPAPPLSPQNQAAMPERSRQDDLYFDDGMVGFEGEFAEDLAAPPEWDAAPFDESIFDNNDTDQYGRPLPGAFAQAQESRRAPDQGVEKQTTDKRDSDMTSRFSAQSGVSNSTAHTSVSADNVQAQSLKRDRTNTLVGVGGSDSVPVAAGILPEAQSMAAYQAALAAAAHVAAASGKFERSPSQNDGASEEDELPAMPQPHGSFHDELDNDDDGFGYEDMDEFELDDDAIIAEANASALANDAEGWYGREFGFYAKPANQHHGSSGNNASQQNGDDYANGGFFGPKGMDSLGRSTSGRVVSREPNLTPITERSEYSNRNSIMSTLGLPPFNTGTPIQSPGLAQLAMMAERGDDQMSLSALLRLRSKAWGGSQASMPSSREGSPRSEYAPWGQNVGHGRKSSFFSAVSRDSEAGSLSGSPTLTMGNFLPPSTAGPGDVNGSGFSGQPANTQTEMAPLSPILDDEPVASTETGNFAEHIKTGAASKRPGMGHRHKGSADSISYTQEEDSGEKRWVMERRRTGECGEVEILEREVVEGGRI
ncbi:hypothetical protein S7711_02063 [Stachybotrys chartarum IBT 7711]|uniref:AGC-kinase C-terminal domain-containing protein n=1 Tax=Stachybotrys chartarum (strain CBS 109288 / IBT 7711) TaxID=1280523 RepID=A0A084AW49_STACB|nr:hypothetical protein S7711_02063 [Stachybotrys chartarum IBT 7711]